MQSLNGPLQLLGGANKCFSIITVQQDRFASSAVEPSICLDEEGVCIQVLDSFQMDCSHKVAFENKIIVFIDFALFYFNRKRAKRSNHVLANRHLANCGMQEVGPLLILYSECQNGDTENIGILLIRVCFAVRRLDNVVVRML